MLFFFSNYFRLETAKELVKWLLERKSIRRRPYRYITTIVTSRLLGKRIRAYTHRYIFYRTRRRLREISDKWCAPHPLCARAAAAVSNMAGSFRLGGNIREARVIRRERLIFKIHHRAAAVVLHTYMCTGWFHPWGCARWQQGVLLLPLNGSRIIERADQDVLAWPPYEMLNITFQWNEN